MSGIKVFIGSLPPGIAESTLGEYLAPYGQVVSLILKSEQRYAFVFFSSMEEAKQAIQSLNGQSIEGATVVAKLANNQGAPGSAAPAQGGAGMWGPGGGGGGHVVPPPAHAGGGGMGAAGERVYVKGLPAGMTDHAVRELFSGYGNVADSKVLVSDGKANDGQGQTVAIVRMSCAAEAQWLVDNLSGNIPQTLERPVEVTFAGARGANGAAERSAPYAPPTGQGGFGGGKGGFGGGKGGGGFVPPPPAVAPPQQHQQHQQQWVLPRPVGGKGVTALPPQAAAVLHPSVGMLKMQCTPSSKLYIKGLPAHADDSYLFKVFSPWGRIVEAVALNKDSYCIGFVQYLTDEEAAEGINNVNGVALADGACLQVSVKTQR